MITRERERLHVSFLGVLSEIELLGWRFFRDLYVETLPEYWEKRAKDFDGVGTADADGKASACRAKAYVLRNYGPDEADVAWLRRTFLSEVAA